MVPDFNQKTVDVLAKRAAFKCSNPDCRIITVGPNSDLNKPTIIGEAAHIYGARQTSKRYKPDMTDAARAEITNAIWLCCNCHKLIDTDEHRFSSNILFTWREQHERYIQSELGNSTDRIQFEEQTNKLALYKNYPPIIRRIIIDKPAGWEWRFTAELMRLLNPPVFQKLNDLRDVLYIRPKNSIEPDKFLDWLQLRMSEALSLLETLNKLFQRLNDSWGELGDDGDMDKIHRITCLIRDWLEQIVIYEENFYFVYVPDEYKTIVNLFKDILGSQVSKLESIPESLDEIVSLIETEHGGTIEKPYVINKTISFEIPSDWTEQMHSELNKLKNILHNIP